MEKCAFCSASTTHLVMEIFRFSCPENGADTRIFPVCDQHLEENQNSSSKLKEKRIFQIIQGVYSQAFKEITK